ncbi:MAG: PQQ-binding-like beta-propeller repeat protein [Planctomycetia bacterium]|nr:PQQ-binding-like beta-propeller repeat protein [Planctomycetia bacterium]
MKVMRRNLVGFAFLCACLATINSQAHAWPTYRANPQRTASDGKPGPAKPTVLWVHKSVEHYITSPVPHGEQMFISGLGAFNVSSFHSISLDPKAAADKRLLWSKTTPALKLPTVSSPAISEGRVIFGDGMHQTDGATLHCLTLDKGMRLWQLKTPPPDRLVHLEGAPTVVGNRAYIGGGSLGVIAVDIGKLTMAGKPVEAADIPKIMAEKWKELLAKYEDEKKKDPDFAIPPTEDQLPRVSPALLWQVGQKKWHVDAPVNVEGDQVLVGSARLDKEMEGDRAMFLLDAKTGNEVWRASLPLNPWGGASVLDKTAVVTGSSIGYYPAQLKGAKGEIAALELGSGKDIWRKEVQGGVPSCATLADDLAICTATDGKVRAFDLKTGDRRWIFDAKTPFFAPVAVSAGVVYAGDLAGVIYAIDLKDGTEKWRLDLGNDPAVKSPGMVYGGPVVHNGRVYVATCNPEGAFSGKPTVIVCIGEK